MRLAGRRLALAVGLSLSAQAALASSSVRCWRATISSNGGVSTDLSGVDAACPVQVSFTEFSGTFAPGDSVPMVWSVALKPAESSTNAVQMPLPPVATLPLDSPVDAKPTQISATYARTCSGDADTCDPSTAATAFTTPQTGNFSSSSSSSSSVAVAGEAVQFVSLTGLKFDAEGSYTIAAMAAIRDSEDASRAYVFAGYTTVNITGSSASAGGSGSTNGGAATHEKGVVRCRMSRQSALNETLDAAASVSESTSCEVGIKVAPLRVTRPATGVAVAWTATLNQRDDADMHMPSPLSTEEINGTSYEIVRSSLSLCKSANACDEYVGADGMEQVVETGPASFSSAGNVSFEASGVTLASAGWHMAMVHLVVAGPSRRYDFVYYFDLLATETDVSESVDTASYVAGTATSYCWSVLADGTATDVSSWSVASAGRDTECPYTSSLSFESMSVEANKTVDLSWTVTQHPSGSFSESKFEGGVNLTSVVDAASQQRVTLPGLFLYACGVGTVCSPFSNTNRTLLFSGSARDLSSDGKAIINASGVRLPSVPGNYTLMAHTVFPNGASRVDVASYGVVTVSAASASSSAGGSGSKSHTLAYVLVSVGSVVGVVAIFFGVVWFRKRRQRQEMEKIVRFGVFGAPARPPTALKTTDSKSSGSSDPFGHGGSFSLTRVEPSPLSFSEEREGSLSYNPYSRASFQDMSFQESNLSFAFSDSERPSVSSEAYDV